LKVLQLHITKTMTANGGISYISTVKTDGNDFYQPTTSFGAMNGGSSYRVTGMYIGDDDEKEEIQQVMSDDDDDDDDDKWGFLV